MVIVKGKENAVLISKDIQDDFGNMAAERERQIVEWCLDNPDDSFTSESITDQIIQPRFKGEKSGVNSLFRKVYNCYDAACEDLARKQVLKRLAAPKNESIVYVFNADFIEEV